MITRRKLADLAYREGTTDAAMLRSLIERAYADDVQEQAKNFKPGTLPPAPPG